MRADTNIRRKRGTGNSPVLWLIKTIDRYRERKIEAKSRDELMKLGDHLLRDLGLDHEGRPLDLPPLTGRNMPGRRTKRPDWSVLQRRRACNTPRTAPEIRLACPR